jgi:hypothetical protein
MFVVPDVRRPGKEHVLEQMGESRAPAALVLRSDVVPKIDGHQRRGVIFVEYDAETVFQ